MATARKMVDQGLAQAPGFHELHQVKGRAALVQARWERQQGRNPRAALQSAETSLRRAKALNPRMADLETDLREVLAFRAEPRGPTGTR